MPLPVVRPSLTKDLATRYATQPAGEAFQVKDTLLPPGQVVRTGTTINATSIQGYNFQNPSGFEVKVLQGVTQMKDAQGSTSKQLSMFIQGFDNTKYHP
jgi:hypothetical protein